MAPNKTISFKFSVKDLGIKEEKKTTARAARKDKLCKTWNPAKVSLEAIRDAISNNFAKYLITMVIGIGEMVYAEKCPKPPAP